MTDEVVYRLWDAIQPRSSRANQEEAAQYAAATAKYLFERVSRVSRSKADWTDKSSTMTFPLDPWGMYAT